MVIIHNFRIGLSDYASKGKENDFPLFETCPNCQCLPFGNLHRNGYYWRFAITEETVVKIPICRWRCLSCKTNISILPDFLIPYFQHTLPTMLRRILQVLQNKKANGSRQLGMYHLKRYMRSLHWVHSYFGDRGEVIGFSGDVKKEATKYMTMILDFGESSFLRRSWGHLSTYFMAH